jgi:hypothetical protein
MATELMPMHRVPRAIFGAAILFIFLWLMDFPKPMVDDLFYTGAGINLAQGGDLSNPLLARQEFPSHFFFMYPPLQSYLLAGWLKVFGINALAMTAFVSLMYFITAAASIAILRHHKAPVWLEWLVPLGVSTSLLAVGLRSEPVSIALTMSGFALFECGRKRPVSLLLAFLLMVMGASAAPRMALFSAALILLAANRLWVLPAAERPPTFRLWASVVTGGTLAILIFLVQIHFRVGEFWHSFHEHAQRVGGRRINLLLGFLDESPFLTNAQFPLVLLLAGLMVFAWQRQRSELTRIALVLAGTFPLVALSGVLGAGTLWYVVLTLLLYAAAVAKNQPALEPKLKVVLVLAICFANISMLATAWGMLGGKIKSDRGPEAGVAFDARSTPEHPVLVDSWVARYIFDYKIPAGLLDIQFAAPFPKSHIVGQMRAGDIYLVGPENVAVLKKETLLDLGVAAWIPFGLPHRFFYRYPCQVFVIPAENCHGLRAKPQLK